MAARPRQSRRREDAELRATVERLQLRLEEAEETLRAIRSGEVDSLVVEGPEGPRVFALEGANHTYRVLVEAMSEGASHLSEEGVVLYCNRRFAEMLGRPLHRVMGRPLRDFVAPSYGDAFDGLLEQARHRETRGEVVLREGTGRDVPAYLSINAGEDAGRRVLCLVATDLRERKRQEALVASEALARAVIEQAADAIVVCDEGFRVIRANQAAARLCGREGTLRLFKDTYVVEIAPAAADLRPGETLAQAAVRGERIVGAPAVVRRRDGSAVDVLASAAPLRGADGRAIGCVIVLVDVSAAKRAEEALRESESRFRAVLENSLDAAYRWDLREGRLDYVSPTVRSILGFSAEEMSAMTTAEVQARTHPDDRPLFDEAMRDVERTGELRTSYRFRRKDGQYRWISTYAVVVKDDEGRPRYRSGVIRDITEQKRHEEALRRANVELAEADRNKSEFVAMLSHELRNPLTPIMNSLHVLERETGTGEKARRALAVMRRQTEQLSRLVGDFLDLTRVARNKIRLQTQRIDLDEIVRNTVEDHRSLFDRAGIGIVVEPSPGPVPIVGDPNRVAQVVGNLLQNAVKFTGRGAETRVAVSFDPTERRALLKVSDTGAGMSADLVSRLFKPFSQGVAVGGPAAGLGLGLALVKALTTLHGGDVSAHSAGPGKGSEFVVRLPLAGEGTSPPEGPPRSAARPRSRRVLIIDDNVDGADTLRDLLAGDAHEVVIANSGPEGLEKARAFRPEVVLCDIRLPGMDGYDVARAIRQDAALRGARLIALSGHALPADVLRAREAGFDQHIAKPPRLSVLEELLASL